jgi:hypothetical protein
LTSAIKSARTAKEGRMLSGRGRNLTVAARAAAALATLWMLAAEPALANPATVDYQCRPALRGGGPLSIDFNSGGKSVTLQFPDGKSIRMPGRTARFYFLYSGEHTKVFGTGQKTITLTVMGQPTRRCVASL